MTLHEFAEQDAYCKKNNTPEGGGCGGCPAKDKDHCADALRNLCGRWLKAWFELMENESSKVFKDISKEIFDGYGLTALNQLSLLKGQMEFNS